MDCDGPRQIKALYKLFAESDCTMVEVNPLAEDDTGTLIAADAKVLGLGLGQG